MTYGRCPSRYVRAEWIDRLVWDSLQKWILGVNDLESILREALREQEQKSNLSRHEKPYPGERTWIVTLSLKQTV
jgi:hypothetical protein